MIDTSFDLVPINTTPEAEVATLAMCSCCEAHKHNKPTTLKPWVELPMDHASPNITNKNLNGFRNCHCDCRHKARFICRKYSIA